MTQFQSTTRMPSAVSEGDLAAIGEGHLAYNKGNACVNGAVDDYLVDGTVPEAGLRCE